MMFMEELFECVFKLCVCGVSYVDIWLSVLFECVAWGVGIVFGEIFSYWVFYFVVKVGWENKELSDIMYVDVSDMD